MINLSYKVEHSRVRGLIYSNKKPIYDRTSNSLIPKVKEYETEILFKTLQDRENKDHWSDQEKWLHLKEDRILTEHEVANLIQQLTDVLNSMQALKTANTLDNS